MKRCVLPGLALGLALLGLANAGPAVRLVPGAPPAPAASATRGEACTQACREEYSSCLIAEKGSPNCNVRFQRCLQACLAGKGK